MTRLYPPYSLSIYLCNILYFRIVTYYFHFFLFTGVLSTLLRFFLPLHFKSFNMKKQKTIMCLIFFLCHLLYRKIVQIIKRFHFFLVFFFFNYLYNSLFHLLYYFFFILYIKSTLKLTFSNSSTKKSKQKVVLPSYNFFSFFFWRGEISWEFSFLLICTNLYCFLWVYSLQLYIALFKKFYTKSTKRTHLGIFLFSLFLSGFHFLRSYSSALLVWQLSILLAAWRLSIFF